jgi:hypothetical protein
MWLTSQDDEFRAKRDDVLRVYYESPRNEHIVCVDEKTGMQARERRYADVPMRQRSCDGAPFVCDVCMDGSMDMTPQEEANAKLIISAPTLTAGADRIATAAGGRRVPERRAL